MKVIDLRVQSIEPLEGDMVDVLTDKYIYECVVVSTGDKPSCFGCIFEKLEGCHRIVCVNSLRADRKNIILKSISRKRKEDNNA